MNEKYQLRGQDEHRNDTGAIRFVPTLDDAFQEFLSGRYWKLSFELPNGRRVRLIMEEGGRTINVTFTDEEMRGQPSPQ